MNYEEWSKSVEVDQTVTLGFSAGDNSRMEEKSFEQKDTKLTK